MTEGRKPPPRNPGARRKQELCANLQMVETVETVELVELVEMVEMVCG